MEQQRRVRAVRLLDVADGPSVNRRREADLCEVAKAGAVGQIARLPLLAVPLPEPRLRHAVCRAPAGGVDGPGGGRADCNKTTLLAGSRRRTEVAPRGARPEHCDW